MTPQGDTDPEDSINKNLSAQQEGIVQESRSTQTAENGDTAESAAGIGDGEALESSVPETGEPETDERISDGEESGLPDAVPGEDESSASTDRE